MLPRRRGKLLRLSSETICDMLDPTRKTTAIPGLTFRQCRTTFATLYDGDAKDRQAILGHSRGRSTKGRFRGAAASLSRGHG
jgi:hypothetical protein